MGLGGLICCHYHYLDHNKVHFLFGNILVRKIINQDTSKIINRLLGSNPPLLPNPQMPQSFAFYYSDVISATKPLFATKYWNF